MKPRARNSKTINNKVRLKHTLKNKKFFKTNSKITEDTLNMYALIKNKKIQKILTEIF